MADTVDVQVLGGSGKIELRSLPIGSLVPTSWNPNSMTEEKFNALFNSISDDGITEPFVVTPIEGTDQFTVIGGHHRLEVAKLLGYSEVPCSVKHGVTEDQIKFQNMKLNVIHGKIDPEKFTKLYEELQAKNPDMDVAREMGIVSPDELSRLIVSAKKDLPEELKDAFDEASKQIRTVDDLVLVLNSLFTMQGDVLKKYSYMILDYEGRDALWIRCKKDDFAVAKKIGTLCFTESVSFDAIVRKLMTDLLSSSPEELGVFFSGLEKIAIPELETAIPTEGKIEEKTNGESPDKP